MYQVNDNTETQGRLQALLPLGLFLTIFVGSGLYFQSLGTDFAFYQVAAPVAALPAIILSVWLSKKSLNAGVEEFLAGAGDSNIMAMCMIYLLAGGFSATAKATGGVDAVVALAMGVIPAGFLLPGLFVTAALISTAMGTSMGTIAAIAPIALGIAGEAGLPLALAAGVVTGGAMFGDNLSIISDTTIAATRTQGCEMRDKFRVNLAVALPAALMTLAFLAFQGNGTAPTAPAQTSILLALPYAAILFMAVSGLNVFAVLTAGIALAGIAGFLSTPDFTLLTLSKEIYGGFTGMQEIFILSMFIGGLSRLMKSQGGLAALEALVSRAIQAMAAGPWGRAAAELGLGGLVFLTNLCTANNTVSILVTGSVAKTIAQRHQVAPRRAAGILDIFACICQGIIPWGAQLLLVGSIFKISPMAVVGQMHYCLALLACTLISLIFTARGKA